MTISIRSRLLAGVIGGMVVLEAAFAVLAHETLSRALVRSFDAVLVSTARTILASVEQTGRDVKADFAEADLSDFHRAERPDYFQIWFGDGRMLASSNGGGESGLRAFSGGLGDPVFIGATLPDGRRGRAVGLRVTPAVDDESATPQVPQQVTLVVARGSEDLDAQLAMLWWLLTGGAGATIMLSVAVGALAVRQGLRPLDKLGKRIAAIRHDDLGTPIPAETVPSELAPLVERLNGLLGRLQQAFRREQTFSADVAHELRTPLAGLRSTIEVSLSRPRGAPEYHAALAGCLEIVLRTQRLVEALLDLGRLEAGRRPARLESVALAGAVETAWRAFEARACERRLAVEMRVGPDLGVRTDRCAVQLALGAMFANAVDHAEPGGRIEIVAGRDEEGVWLESTNTGCRLDPADAALVFERFWRGDAARAGAGLHHGLGLALARRALATAGATVSAGVEEGRFMLRIVWPTGDVPA